MLVAILIHGAESILIQVYVRYAYLLEALEKGQVSLLQPNFFSDIRKGLMTVNYNIFTLRCEIIVVASLSCPPPFFLFVLAPFTPLSMYVQEDRSLDSLPRFILFAELRYN
jgi:hypothetical protein